MSAITADFGYHPGPLTVRSASIQIEPLPELEKIVATLAGYERIERGWLYAPPEKRIVLSGTINELPYPARIFGLPKTHRITHASADSGQHLAFHLWALSFFEGIRLTTTEAGFVDATPLHPGTLVDFLPLGSSREVALELADAFWAKGRGHREHPSRFFIAAVHALFLGQSPRNLQFEAFTFLYMALDACFALASALRPPEGRIPHTDRVRWMCDLFGLSTPDWADPAAPAGSEVASLRNAAFHEALFVGEPLGFAVQGVGSPRNLMLELKALLCRLLVALIGGTAVDYIRSPVGTRQRHGLKLD